MNSVRHDIEKAYQAVHNWRRVGEMFGVNGAMAFRIVKENYEPKDPAIRLELGLPAMLPAPVCQKCGVVHVTQRCTHRRPVYHSLWETPVDELRRMLLEREEVN